MKPKLSPAEQEQRRADALAAAQKEAAQLREIVRLRREEGVRYADGMRRVGLVLPHTSFQQRLERLKQSGVEGLLDKRHPPPSRLTPEIRGFIEGVGHANQQLPVPAIIEMVYERFKVRFKTRTVQEVLSDAGLARPVVRFSSEVQPATLRAAACPPTEEPLPAAGMAWLTVGDELVGYTAGIAESIQELTHDLPPPGPVTAEEQELRDEKGRFLPEYNAPEERRDPQIGARFEDVETKRQDKDLGRLRIARCRPENLQAKLRALMAMPLVSHRGRFDGATDVRGTWLAGLGALDFQPETLAKFARELKWLGASSTMMERHAQIWHDRAANWIGEDACCSILYVDSTAKPLWTESFHKSGRVATLGRVMPCVETTMIHQGAGVPLWIRTYSGHVPLVNNVLPLIDELEAAVGKGMIGRLTVIDGEMDCAALFKEFDRRKRLFIAPLDKSRVKSLGAIEGLREFQPYREGDQITGGWATITDSAAPDEPYRTRVIVLKRRTKATHTVFATNAPVTEFVDAILADAYFGRWPKQEAVFRQLNAATAFKAVHGYGKKRVQNVTVLDDLTQTKAQIERLEHRRNRALSTANRTREILHRRDLELSKAERTVERSSDRRKQLREQGAGHTTGYSELGHKLELDQRKREIAKFKVAVAKQRHQKAIEKVPALADQISRKLEEQGVLENRREIYQTDVELDQILSVLKVGFAVVLQYLIHEFFGSLPIDLVYFAHHFLLMPGVRLRTDTTETIRFIAHRRHPDMMKLLEIACSRFNALRHHHQGRLVQFEVHATSGP
jgi:hypothetical protein